MLCAVLLVLCAGCRNGNREQETVWRDGGLLRIGESQVDVREAYVYLFAVKEEYEQYYGDGIWSYVIDDKENTLGTLIKEQVLEQVLYIKVVCQKADELNLVLTEEELFEVEEKTRAFMERDKTAALLQYGVNEDIVRRIYTDNVLARKMFEYTTLSVDTDIPNEEAGQHRWYSIAIRSYKIDASGAKNYYSEQEKQELRVRMEQLHKQALECAKAEEFYRLAQGKTENDELLELVAGPGDLPEEYASAVLGLKSGEVSEVIETEDYFYIFYCVKDFDVDATHEKKEQMIAKRQQEEFMKQYEVWKRQTETEVNERLWNEVKF